MTRLEWFQTFPEPWKSQAIANCQQYGGREALSGNVDTAISRSGFYWGGTPEGDTYWRQFFRHQKLSRTDQDKAKRGTPL